MQLAEAKTVVDTLLATSQAEATPKREEALVRAVIGAARGAGNELWRRALNALQANQVADAEALFRMVAQQKERAAPSPNREAAAAYRDLGAIAGLAHPERAREAYARAAALNPHDIEALSLHAAAQLEAGFLAEAKKAYRRLLALNRLGWAAIEARCGLGDIARIGGDLNTALEHYLEAERSAKRLAKAEPANTRRQRDLVACYLNVGNVLAERGNLPGALKFLRTGAAIVERLAKADPGSANWQPDLSMFCDKIGKLLMAQGEVAEALDVFQHGLAIVEQFASTVPRKAGSRRDLAATYKEVGDFLVEQANLLVAQGNLPEALRVFRKCL